AASSNKTVITGAYPVFHNRPLFTPNDSLVASQEYLNVMRAFQAWDKTRGDSSVFIVISDAGTRTTHEDLAAKVSVNRKEIPGNAIDDDGNGYVDDIHGYDFVNNDANPMDDNGHGTHVSGTIGAVGNNGIGVAGVNWHTKIMALKFLDASGSGYLSDAIRALDYAVANGARISNNSWG
ncbi:MAG: S8 family serine peptidase, partial [Candidatus Kapaibacterium sp.]